MTFPKHVRRQCAIFLQKRFFRFIFFSSIRKLWLNWLRANTFIRILPTHNIVLEHVKQSTKWNIKMVDVHLSHRTNELLLIGYILQLLFTVNAATLPTTLSKNVKCKLAQFIIIIWLWAYAECRCKHAIYAFFFYPFYYVFVCACIFFFYYLQNDNIDVRHLP